MVLGLTRPGTEPESIASIADALSTRPLIGYERARALAPLMRALIRVKARSGK